MNGQDTNINCRVCLRYDLKVSSKCLSLFETYNGCSIAAKINLIAHVNIQIGDGLPDVICPDCLLQLENAISFKQKCEASNKILLCNALLSANTINEPPKKPKVSTVTIIQKPTVKQEESKVEKCTEPEKHSADDSDTEDRLEDSLEFLVERDESTFKKNLEFLVERDENTVKKSLEFLVERDESTLKKSSESLVERDESTLKKSSEFLVERDENTVKKRRLKDLKLICDDCGGSFRTKCKLRMHWKSVHQPERLVCQSCKRVFKTYKTFNLHKKSNNRNCLAASKVFVEGQGKSRIFHCKECSYTTRRIKDIDTHWSTHSGDRRFQCKDCPKSFTQHSSLQCHRESTHKDYRVDTTCHLCGKHLLGRTRYYKHMKTHTQEGVQCKVCNKQLKSKKYLPIHMLRHSGVKSFSCEICAASFYTYCEVYNHRKKVHMKSRNIKCDQCDYKMTTISALKIHKAKHIGTNEICLVCGQFSENAEKLALHQKRHYERHLQCPQCDKTFHNKKALNKHMCKDHRCSMLVEKREEVLESYTSMKADSPPHNNKEEIVILLSPETVILK